VRLYTVVAQLRARGEYVEADPTPFNTWVRAKFPMVHITFGRFVWWVFCLVVCLDLGRLFVYYCIVAICLMFA
jgi:hypothetical protein